MTSPIQTPEELADEQRIAKQRLQEREEYDALSKAYLVAFGSPQGIRVWEDIQRRAFFWETTLGPKATPVDVNGVLVNEGARTLALYIQGRIEHGKVAD